MDEILKNNIDRLSNNILSLTKGLEPFVRSVITEDLTLIHDLYKNMFELVRNKDRLMSHYKILDLECEIVNMKNEIEDLKCKVASSHQEMLMEE